MRHPTHPARRGRPFVALERAVLGSAMWLVAVVLERRVLRAVKEAPARG